MEVARYGFNLDHFNIVMRFQMDRGIKEVVLISEKEFERKFGIGNYDIEETKNVLYLKENKVREFMADHFLSKDDAVNRLCTEYERGITETKSIWDEILQRRLNM